MFAEWKRVSLMWFNSNTSQDLAKAFLLVLSNEKASKQVFNISGEKYVTFDGLARACAKVTLKICLQNGKKRNQKLKNFMKWLEFYDYLHVFVLCVSYRVPGFLSLRLFTTTPRSSILAKRKHSHSVTR